MVSYLWVSILPFSSSLVVLHLTSDIKQGRYKIGEPDVIIDVIHTYIHTFSPAWSQPWRRTSMEKNEHKLQKKKEFFVVLRACVFVFFSFFSLFLFLDKGKSEKLYGTISTTTNKTISTPLTTILRHIPQCHQPSDFTVFRTPVR